MQEKLKPKMEKIDHDFHGIIKLLLQQRKIQKEIEHRFTEISIYLASLRAEIKGEK